MFETDPDRWSQPPLAEWIRSRQLRRIPARIRRESGGLIHAIRTQAPAVRLAFKDSWHIPILIRNVLAGLLVGVAISTVGQIIGEPGGLATWILVAPTLGFGVWAGTVAVAVMRHEGIRPGVEPTSDLEIQWQGPDEIAEAIGSLTLIIRDIEGRDRTEGGARIRLTHPAPASASLSRSLSRRPFVAFGHVPSTPPRLG